MHGITEHLEGPTEGIYISHLIFEVGVFEEFLMYDQICDVIWYMNKAMSFSFLICIRKANIFSFSVAHFMENKYLASSG